MSHAIIIPNALADACVESPQRPASGNTRRSGRVRQADHGPDRSLGVLSRSSDTNSINSRACAVRAAVHAGLTARRHRTRSGIGLRISPSRGVSGPAEPSQQPIPAPQDPRPLSASIRAPPQPSTGYSTRPRLPHLQRPKGPGCSEPSIYRSPVKSSHSPARQAGGCSTQGRQQGDADLRSEHVAVSRTDPYLGNQVLDTFEREQPVLHRHRRRWHLRVHSGGEFRSLPID